MRIALGADADHPLFATVAVWCAEAGHTPVWVAEAAAWPEVGRLVGEAVVAGQADRGVVMCWTGTGVSIAANKVHGVRAALCGDPETARGARRWNDANVLALSMRATSSEIAREILVAFFGPEIVDADELANIAALE